MLQLATLVLQSLFYLVSIGMTILIFGEKIQSKRKSVFPKTPLL